MKKKIIASIFLYEKEAVTSFDNLEVLHKDPVALARYYAEHHADALLLLDLSLGEKEHEAALELIREICAAVEIPCIGAGNVRRPEDIKKLLYAGCHKAVLNYSKEGNIAMTQEVSERFGKEKIAVSVAESETLRHFEDVIQEYTSEVIFLGKEGARTAVHTAGVPVILQTPEVSLDKLIEMMKMENLSGIMGEMINNNAREFTSLKMLLKQNGVSMEALEVSFCWEEFKKNSDGMVPVIVQDYKTDTVLMMAYMNKEAYEKTISGGKMTYWSRSRDCLWVKGESSGHTQYVKSLTTDCDKDTILARVAQTGPACHTGSYSCFFREIMEREAEHNRNPLKVFEKVSGVIHDRKLHPKEGSYTNYLFDKGLDKILKKLGEEAAEIIIAAKNPEAGEIKYEIADFLYHMMVLMEEKNITWEEITEELSKR
ncbi:MAG: bifunctional phosphoribosyl-AMP cyclohydrolase/phosphoribosyl-ATP diphosphatase HisIE [Lachnospiraceae bacterium]|nr:bifunctional phosphoribosyl-AMP cyclohydrolase/phosphoribosyl-ATP diphosphatase HisIE [Lachnospiraceae bacterium]